MEQATDVEKATAMSELLDFRRMNKFGDLLTTGILTILYLHSYGSALTYSENTIGKIDLLYRLHINDLYPLNKKLVKGFEELLQRGFTLRLTNSSMKTDVPTLQKFAILVMTTRNIDLSLLYLILSIINMSLLYFIFSVSDLYPLNKKLEKGFEELAKAFEELLRRSFTLRLTNSSMKSVVKF